MIKWIILSVECPVGRPLVGMIESNNTMKSQITVKINHSTSRLLS